MQRLHVYFPSNDKQEGQYSCCALYDHYRIRLIPTFSGFQGLDEHAQNKHSKSGVDCFGAEVYNASK